jgi:uncharacterized membrane protein
VNTGKQRLNIVAADVRGGAAGAMTRAITEPLRSAVHPSRSAMTDAIVPSTTNAEPGEAARTTLLIAYICYAAAIVLPVAPAIAGVIINHLKIDETRNSYIGSHHRWLLRTFWFSLLWSVVTSLLLLTILLAPLAWLGYLAAGVWYIYRVVRGAMCFADRKAMPA